MLDETSGKIFIIDLEEGSPPQLGTEPHKILTELQAFLQESTQIKDEARLRAFLTGSPR